MFKIYHMGLFERKHITDVETEEEAQNMCLQNNSKIPHEMLEACIGNMSYIEEK